MRVYIESTIPSYIVARPPRDLLQAAPIMTRLRRLVEEAGYPLPAICTPEELMEEPYE
jgi:hypothetical protein